MGAGEQPNQTMAKPKIMLAYSGGLDTTVAVRWLQEKYDADIITLTVDLGMVDLESYFSCGRGTGGCNGYPRIPRNH